MANTSHQVHSFLAMIACLALSVSGVAVASGPPQPHTRPVGPAAIADPTTNIDKPAARTADSDPLQSCQESPAGALCDPKDAAPLPRPPQAQH